MKESERAHFFRQALLGLWALATLILFFSLGLVVYDMFEKGYDPFPAPPKGDRSVVRLPLGKDADTVQRRVTLYFLNSEGTGLVGESREFSLGSFTQENCARILSGLIEGPQSPNCFAILPKSTAIRNVFLLDSGEVVIDFSREIQTDPARPKSAHAEALMAYGIANTLCQPSVAGEKDRRVTAVRFLFEGGPFPTTFPEHLDFSGGFTADASWFASPGS